MSVPIDNLCHFIHHLTEKKFCMLSFYPFGNKNPDNIIISEETSNIQHRVGKEYLIANKIYKNQIDINNLHNFFKVAYQPVLFCHDQEPLFFEYYSDINMFDHNIDIYQDFYPYKDFNLRWAFPYNHQKYWILLHSEKNSRNLEMYENTNRFVGAYYWCHAFISLDWYRYAEYDTSIAYNTNSKKFLVYCRDTTGSREYRKTFLDFVSNAKLSNCCQFHSKWFPTVDSPALSADYNSEDISNTDFSIVLETVFDERIHLTEKTCRALATGHPFLLAAGPGSLKLLRDYGFKTFSPWIDENYDTETDPEKRLEQIVYAMKCYHNLPDSERKEVINHCREIAQYNKKHFFSNEFFTMCLDELKTNINNAYQTVCKDMFDIDRYFKNLDWKIKNCNRPVEKWRDPKRNLIDLDFFEYLKKGGTLEDYVPPDLD